MPKVSSEIRIAHKPEKNRLANLTRNRIATNHQPKSRDQRIGSIEQEFPWGRWRFATIFEPFENSLVRFHPLALASKSQKVAAEPASNIVNRKPLKRLLRIPTCVPLIDDASQRFLYKLFYIGPPLREGPPDKIDGEPHSQTLPTLSGYLRTSR